MGEFSAVKGLLFVLVVLALYMLPTIIAFHRVHPNRWLIGLVNFVFGCSVIGWVGSLIWACHAFLKSPTGNNGGETGLNLFINDVSASDRAHISDEALDNLVKLKSLREQNVISEDEFRTMKARYINLSLQ